MTEGSAVESLSAQLAELKMAVDALTRTVVAEFTANQQKLSALEVSIAGIGTGQKRATNRSASKTASEMPKGEGKSMNRTQKFVEEWVEDPEAARAKYLDQEELGTMGLGEILDEHMQSSSHSKKVGADASRAAANFIWKTYMVPKKDTFIEELLKRSNEGYDEYIKTFRGGSGEQAQTEDDSPTTSKKTTAPKKTAGKKTAPKKTKAATKTTAKKSTKDDDDTVAPDDDATAPDDDATNNGTEEPGPEPDDETTEAPPKKKTMVKKTVKSTKKTASPKTAPKKA